MKNNIRGYQILIVLMTVIVCAFHIISNIMQSSIMAVFGVNMLLISLAIYCLKDFSYKIGLAFFYVCMFTFLGAGAILPFWKGDTDIMNGLSTEEFISACNAFSISCFFLAIGYQSAGKFRITVGGSGGKPLISDNKIVVDKLQQLTFYLFLGSTLVALIYEIKALLYVLANGYISLYTSYSTSSIATRALIVSRACFFIGLAAKPAKKRAYMYMIIGLLIPILELVEGTRSQAVMTAMFIGFYFYQFKEYRFELTSRRRKQKRFFKFLLIGTVVSLVAIPFLYTWGYVRVGRTFQTSGLLGYVISFFKGQGGSFALIGYAVRYKGQLPGICYSFGSIVDRILGNNYESFTVEAAMNTNNFGTVMTYLVKTWNYLNLYDGLGSSYVAELFYDFGYLGLIIGNIFIGVILKKVVSWKSNSIFGQALLFTFFYYTLSIPRAPLMNPILQIASITNVMTFVILFGLSYRQRVIHSMERKELNKL